MKKIVSLFMLLLCFTAMAIGANFTNTPAKERDDGELIAQHYPSPAEVQLQEISTIGTNYLQAVPPPRWEWTATENNPQSTAKSRQYWPSGNSKAYRCGLESISYTTKSIAPTSYNSEWPTACSIARTCGGLLEVAKYNPAHVPLNLPLG